MNTILARLGVALLFALAAESSFADDPVVRPVGEGAFLNSDCIWPLVVRFQRCREECREDRDCTGGWVCTREGKYGVCKAPPPPPPAPGGFTGRVERAPGEGVPCSIEVWRGSSMAMTVGCNATSGNFSAENLPVGLYRLHVTAGSGMYPGRREFLAPVNAGEITYLGALVVANPTVISPVHPGLDAAGGTAPAPVGPMRVAPQVGRDPPVR